MSSNDGSDEEYFVRIGAGGEVFREGEAGNEMFIIREGEVEICKQIGGLERSIAVLSEGDFFGEMAVIEDFPRHASARARSDCVLLRVDRSTFDQIVRHNPEIAVRMLRKLSRRLRATDPLLLEVDLPPGGARELPTEPLPELPTPATAGRARLVHKATGQEFFLAPRDQTYVGRHDAATGIRPDVDLLPVDDEHTISRRHAKIIHHDGQFFLCEEVGTANGTFLNRKRVRTGKEVKIRDGDEIRFGLVATVFHAR